MEKPLVSVIIPTYNGEKYLAFALVSVIQQTYKNIEIIIINDGSSDGTENIISRFKQKDQRIISIKNEKNLGLAKSLNKAINVAKGKYIARLDDDDRWCDVNKVEKQVGFLEGHKGYVLVGGGIISVDKTGKEIMRYLFPENDEDIRKSILIGNTFAHSAVLFRKDIFEKLGRYDEKYCFSGEDWDMWLKIGMDHKFYNFQDYFIFYLDKEYDNIYSSRNRGIRRNINLSIKLRKKYRNNYPNFWLSIIIYFMSYFYSFLPFREKLKPILLKIKKLFFLPSQYKYFKP